jgi:hypothetical protein
MEENYLTEEIFLKDGKLLVDEQYWSLVKKHHSKQDVQSYIHSLIIKYDIPFPYKEYTELGLKEEFLKLKNTHHYGIISYAKWSSHRLEIPNFDFTYEGRYLGLMPNIVGRNCSDNFSQIERMKCGATNFPTPPVELWRTQKNIFRFLYNLCDRVNSGTLRATIGNTGYIASQFSPMCAKAIYDMFDCKNVLDLSMGWGDRLVGALSSSIDSYTGIDPNSNMHPQYAKINSFYKHNKRTRFICSPAEDVELDANQFDMVFTSPPYFDRERYSDEDTQSWKRYGTNVESWLNGFLFKVMRNSYDWLKEGGRLILNINDVSKTPFCKEMLDYALELGFNYEGVIGYGMQSRPGKNTSTEAVIYEPMFVWVKGKAKNKIQVEPTDTLF